MRSPRSTPIVSCCCLKISFLFFATVIIFFTAGLLSLVLRARRLLGAYRIPKETGLLIPSGKFGQVVSFVPASGRVPRRNCQVETFRFFVQGFPKAPCETSMHSVCS